MVRMENLLLSVPTDEDLRRAYYEDTQAFLQRQRARIQVRGVWWGVLGVLAFGDRDGGGLTCVNRTGPCNTLGTGPEGPARGALRPVGMPLGGWVGGRGGMGNGGSGGCWAGWGMKDV